MPASADYLVRMRAHLGELAAGQHPDLHARVVETAAGLGYHGGEPVRGMWSALVKAAALSGRTLDAVTDADVDSAQEALRAARVAWVGPSGWSSRDDGCENWTGLRTVRFHAGLSDQPPAPVTRNSKRLAREAQWAAVTPGLAATMGDYLVQVRASGARPSTCGRDERVLREFGLFITGTDPAVRRVADLRRAHVESYKAYLAGRRTIRGGRLSPVTVGHILNALSVFFDRLTAWESPDAPAGRLLFAGDYPRVDKPLPRFLDDPAAAKLMAAARAQPDAFTRLAIELLARTGLRRGELLALSVRAVVQIGSAFWLQVPVGKTRNDRYVPLHPELKDLLDAWIAARPANLRSDLLFTEYGRPVHSARVHRALAGVAQAAGLGHVTPHQLRHTLATQAINRGMSMEAIAALLGHTDLSMTQVYAKIGNRTVAEQYFAVTEKIEALYTQPRRLPAEDEGAEMRKLRSEMHRRMLGNGYCARPVELDCHFESICESCTFFVTTIAFRPTLKAQRDDAAAKANSAGKRSSTASWTASTPTPNRTAAERGQPMGAAPARRPDDGQDLG